MRRCIYCQARLMNSNRACEHIVPQWLQKSRGFTAQELATGFGDVNTLTVERWLGMMSFVAGGVCARCNNGWMSKLETECRPLLVNLIDGITTTDMLKETERLMLARWSVKTAIACNSTTREDERLDPIHAKIFDQGRSPNIGRCGVFIRRLALKNRFGYVQKAYSSELLIRPPATFPDVRIAFYLDGLVIIIAFVDPVLRYTFEVHDPNTRPLWPTRGHDVRTPGTPLSLSGTESDLKTLLETIDVRYSL
jgi:hypothetical protein